MGLGSRRRPDLCYRRNAAEPEVRSCKTVLIFEAAPALSAVFVLALEAPAPSAVFVLALEVGKVFGRP